jgi:hypothetical protein
MPDVRRRGEAVSVFAGLPPVDRRLFIPDEVWVPHDDGTGLAWARLSRTHDPQGWAETWSLRTTR